MVLELFDRCVRRTSGGELGRFFHFLKFVLTYHENIIFLSADVRVKT